MYSRKGKFVSLKVAFSWNYVRNFIYKKQHVTQTIYIGK